MVAAQQRQGQSHSAKLAGIQAQLRALSPSHTLARGYAIVRTGQGAIVRRADSLKVGAQLDVTLSEGSLAVQIESIRKGDA
jgi:exodeoxyribonuclease VII large subunit